MPNPVLQRFTKADGSPIGWVHWCPGCESYHAFRVEDGAVRWAFNGNQEKPSFAPSMSISWAYGNPPKDHRCHYVLTDGVINFQGDCTHPLVGKAVPLEPMPNPLPWGSAAHGGPPE